MWAELWLPDLQVVINSFPHKTNSVLTEFNFFFFIHVKNKTEQRYCDGILFFCGVFFKSWSLKILETTFCFWFLQRSPLPDWKSFWCERPLQHPFISSLHHFLRTLRYAKVLFSSVLRLGLWEVVSVVYQFSHVSKVNTLCVTQIFKCFCYNTGFFLDTYRARLLPESRRQPLSVEHSRFAPNPGSDNIKALHAGGWICILWVSDHWPKQQRHVIQSTLPSRPCFPHAFCGISKQNSGLWGET